MPPLARVRAGLSCVSTGCNGFWQAGKWFDNHARPADDCAVLPVSDDWAGAFLSADRGQGTGLGSGRRIDHRAGRPALAFEIRYAPSHTSTAICYPGRELLSGVRPFREPKALVQAARCLPLGAQDHVVVFGELGRPAPLVPFLVLSFLRGDLVVKRIQMLPDEIKILVACHVVSKMPVTFPLTPHR